MGPGLPRPSGSFPSNRDLSPSSGYLLIKLCVHFSNSFIRVLWLKTHFQSQNESCKSVPGAKRIGKPILLKNAKVKKDKERLKNCSRSKETKKYVDLIAILDLVWDPDL